MRAHPLSRKTSTEPPKKPERISVEQISQLWLVWLRRTIPEEYPDFNNHVNVRWYVPLFDDAGDILHT
jgi:hypothetical protein